MKTTPKTKLKSSEPEKTRESLVRRDENGRLLPGSSLNPNGPGKGYSTYKTEFRQAIKKLAHANKIDEDEAMAVLHRVGYKKAQEGDPRFWDSVMDRYYGKPKGDEQPEAPPEVNIIKEQKNIYVVVKEAEEKLRKELEQ